MAATGTQTVILHGESVEWWGARGDGVADDTAAIVAATEALSSRGGIVYFPPGTYRHTGLTLTRSHVTWQGAGRTDDSPQQNVGTSILYHSSTGPAITIAGTRPVANLTIRDLAIQGTTLATAGIRLRGDHIDNFLARSVFKNVSIEGFLGAGAVGLAIDGGIENTVAGCYVRNNDTGILITADVAGTTTTRITNCRIRVNVAAGLHITGAVNTVLVDGMTVIEGNQGPGVLLDQPTNVLMSDLTFRDVWIGSNNLTTGAYQFETNTHGWGTNIRQLLVSGVSFWSPGARTPGDLHLDGVLGAVIGPMTGGAVKGTNIIKIEATSSDVQWGQILGASGGRIDPDLRGAVRTPYVTYPGG